MRLSFVRILSIVLIATSLVSCANRGTPSGGEEDVDPPVILNVVPENFSTNFKGDEIKI